MDNKEQEKVINQIEKFFEVPERVADKIKIIAEKVRGGYVLIETRPRWDGSAGPWTKHPIAKIVFHNPLQEWRVYWMRASGKWWFYGQYKTFNKVLKIIDEDKDGCFWG
ncbi:MAG: hypothetical protein A3A98_02180 [Candidatus Staskawiczbacteria bacterium RIFCSPLOWO2_01_FULL_40_39]|uniref:DUF3024 domain-containing protein n=1 Tax=Candidatus Staskawiczbacteria bacterium RIFCSPHIGHO2_01_FULL_39_25 TaxID=1802202 RepID=A0A1G2HQK0_9BACT|nr:MAG: hypothetical protein A2730_03790 [Candidatus Staskawiczbacteria bacterium RIFCSPHIGHO2_01_FULL_39_25]OGZ74059.1 MAG: hypothetical protein A3A98_02180 [Candidatus Staskawiczbacteria bacterium RIFCSPLOWO2_01_FULL_40_39]OGZ76248.1 MAG: hypothetical protein A3I87_02235 [Candidatus Staskawiczbacteria bacterium RIFCSPLOWO2_02_FULL_39_8]